MSNSIYLVGFRRHCNMLLLVLLSTLAVTVNSQTDMINYCGLKPCIEAVRLSCEEMIERYEFQGSCCSLETIPATGGCRLTVSFGNCFYYPWCGECGEAEENQSRCNNIFETGADERPCPAGDYDPLAIQSAEDFTAPSCPPSMSPTMSPDDESGSSTLAMTGIAGLLAVAIAFVAA